MKIDKKGDEMKAIWEGSISFGLVNIPVKLYSAVESKVLAFKYYHKKDLSPIHYERFCESENKQVGFEEIVKGYQLDGEIIPILAEDFEKADIKSTHNIEIINFVREEEIDSIYYDLPYFLEPDKGADKAFALLKTALEKSKRVGVAKFVLRNREHLTVLKPFKNGLIVNNIRFSNELRSGGQLRMPEVSVSEQEISLALALIDQLTQKFEPTKYRDLYSDKLIKIIEQKAKGKSVKAVGSVLRPTQINDLMVTLKESLKKSKVKAR